MRDFAKELKCLVNNQIKDGEDTPSLSYQKELCMQLNPAQRKAITHKSGPCMVLAGPGSGKTTVITKRIEYLIKKYRVKPEEILVVTFSKAAANEMRTRFHRICEEEHRGVTFGTFHGIYYGILKCAYGLTSQNILTEEEKYQILQNALVRSGYEYDDEKETIRDIAEEIGVVKNNRIPIQEYKSRSCDNTIFQKVYQWYENERRRQKKIDFDDMLVMTCELFKERPDILEGWQNKYRYILVDEFQDINRVQYDVVRMLAAPDNHLFIVGDDDQSIYRFRGAAPEIMLNFPKDYPETKTIVLDVNYRSTRAIVRVAERVIQKNCKRYQKKMITGNAQGANVHVQETKNPLDESRFVAKEIKKQLDKGVKPTEIAVLYRTSQEARILVETFLEYGIQFRMNEQLPSIYDHFVARDILAYIQMALGDRSRTQFLKIMNRPNRYLERECVERAEVSFESLRKYYADKEWMIDRIDQLELDLRVLGRCAPYAAIQYLRKHIGYDSFLEAYAKKRHVNYEELLEVVFEIEERAKEFANFEEWFDYIEEYKKQEVKRKAEESCIDRVLLSTMHGAKGLEFDTVFVVGVNEEIVPYKKAMLEEEMEEERRLFYVAITRAKGKLCLSYVKEKTGKKMKPSRFIRELMKG